MTGRDVKNRLADTFGADPLRLLTWTTNGDTGGAPADPLEAGDLANVTITRGRTDGVSQPGPAVCSLTRAGAFALDGTPYQGLLHRFCRLVLSDAALDVLFGSHTSAAALSARIRYSGRVTDFGPVEIRPDGKQVSAPITFTSLLALLNSTPIGTTPWPAGTKDLDIVKAAIVLALRADGSARVAEWAQLVPTVHQWQQDAITGQGYLTLPMQARTQDPASLVAYDVDKQTAMAVIQPVADSVMGVLVETRSGAFDWLTPRLRRVLGLYPVAAELTAGDVLAPLTAELNEADLITRADITWGPTDAQQTASVTVNGVDLDATDPNLWDGDYQAYGWSPTSRQTLLDSEAQAAAIGRDWIGRYGVPRWRLTRATVDILRLWDAGKADLVRALLQMESGQMVSITGMPAGSPVPDGWYFVEGSTEAISAGNWTMTLALVAFELLAPAVTWSALSLAGVATTWDDVPASLDNGVPLTWLHATYWHPET